MIQSNFQLKQIILPVGISFFTFQATSYISDIYQGKIKAETYFPNVVLFLTFFPTVTSGPILRYGQFQNQLVEREISLSNISQGLRRFFIGLFKKVVIANQLGLITNLSFRLNTEIDFILAWLGAIAYMIQIYMDFSGYSDMAIAISQMLGFQISENFNEPYSAISITEFWRRWHMSLGTWFKDYVYIPLGGNRVKKLRHIINILIVWMLTGLWHGASINFIIWGLYFGILLLIEKYIEKNILSKLPSFFRHLLTLFFLFFGWIIFRISSLEQFTYYLHQMFSTKFFTLAQLKQLDILYLYPILVLGLFGCTSLARKSYVFLDKKIPVLVDILLLVGFIWSIIILINSSFSPFIYFNF